LTQLSAVVGFVAEHLPGCFGAPDQTLGWRTIVSLTASQQDGKKTAFSIGDCMDFRVAPAARASNSLALFPLFAPEAERCALTWVASIICVCVDRPCAARSRNNRSHRPALRLGASSALQVGTRMSVRLKGNRPREGKPVRGRLPKARRIGTWRKDVHERMSQALLRSRFILSAARKASALKETPK
jgi:hypothetical protein